MRTIVEPKEHIDKLWGKQRIREEAHYRMMRYVLRVNHAGKVLLHNVVTGQLVVLDRDETETIEKLPLQYEPSIEQLVLNHYVVPEDYDEHQQVLNLRMILHAVANAQKPKCISRYTILPTTACNARCYYCFEKGSKSVTMTEQTADALVTFIAAHCADSRYVEFQWFGGEPTVATNRIEQICEKLRDRGIQFSSSMITNGYLFDDEMVSRAKYIWKLQGLQISVDGTESSYNKIKAFVGVQDNPYERVMRNIGILLKNKIRVGLRMNFDLGNYREFYELTDEIQQRYSSECIKYLHLSAHPVIGEHLDNDGRVLHGTDEWFAEEKKKLNAYAASKGLQRTRFVLPELRFESCQACQDSFAVISPEGLISKCPEQFAACDAVGDIWNGITNKELLDTWAENADYPMCQDCILFPNCCRPINCGNKGYCHKVAEWVSLSHKRIINLFETNMNKIS